MRAPALALLLMLASGLAPLAEAASERIAVPALHVGDRLLYRSVSEERVVTAEGEAPPGVLGRIPWTGTMETLVTIEGRSVARDEYGIERETVAFLIERARDDRIIARERCHMEPALGWALRRDHLEGGPQNGHEWEHRPEQPLFGSGSRFYNTTTLVHFRTNPCDGFWEPGYADFREGEQIHMGHHFRGVPTMPAPSFARESAPARATTWNGLPAMEYAFVLSLDTIETTATGTARLVFAQGLPGPVVVEIAFVEKGAHATWTSRGTRELIGFEAGDKPFPTDIPWREHPLRSPLATFPLAAPRHGVPDAELGLVYPFAQALEAMRGDGSLGLSEHFAANPESALVYAEFSIKMRLPGRLGEIRPFVPAPAETAGPGWLACFAAERATFCARSVRPEGTGLAFHGREDSEHIQLVRVPPYEAASPRDIARLANEAGIGMGTVKSLVWWAGAYDGYVVSDLTLAQVDLRDLREDEGIVALIDPDTASLHQVDAASVRLTSDGLLSAADPPRAIAPAAARAAWATMGVSPVAATAVAIGGLALLAVAIKLLAPLYTRLRRDRLLDNPVRARLYEAIRADPGAHLAQLDELLGVGKGALRHHVDQLADHGFVFLVEEAGYTRAYATGHVPPEVARASAVLRAGSHQRVYDLFAARPDATLREAARELGMSAPSVHKAKRKLEAAGLLPAPTPGEVALDKRATG